jgi:hypothetical protein
MNSQVPLTQYHANLFQRLLESTSVHSLLPMLDARSRWLLIIEILLGNAPVRGGRSRDYPFSVDRADSTRIAYQLIGCEKTFAPGRSKVSGSYSMYDLIVALQCIEACYTSNAIELDGSEQHFTMAIRVLIEMLFPVESHRPVLDSLGVSDSGEDGALKKCHSYRKREISMARRLAVLARTEVPSCYASAPIAFLNSRFELREREIAELEGVNFSLIYLKTKEAQSFIDRCLSPFIQRGASFWCSQTSARVRDLLTSNSFGELGIFLDNDAITILSGPAGKKVSDIEARIRIMLFEPSNSRQVSKTFIETNYPRLMPYYRAANEGGIETATAMPAFGVQVRIKSLLDIATDSVPADTLYNSSLEEESIVIGSIRNTCKVADLPCSGRKGDIRIKSSERAIPSWYNPRIGEGYGFPSIAFSLAELTYSKAGGRAISHQLKERGCANLSTVSTQLELLERTSAPDRRLAYLKYDGDSFGTKFSAVPSLRRPGLSMTLEMLMRESWLSAVAYLAKQHNFTVVPADLVYFGGDDILITLPAYLLNEFLKAFDEALVSISRSSDGVTFTFSAVTFHLPVVDYSDREKDTNMHITTIGEVNDLLLEAKRYHRSTEHLISNYFGKPCQWISLQRTQGFSIEYQIPIVALSKTTA